MNNNQDGILYIVATPIGNLEDISYRAIRVLSEVDCIAAEDTRHTRKLLHHYGIETTILSYYREKEQQKSQHLIKLLEEGKHIALVSDAGTPGISDPGSILVKHARNKNLKIVPIPGPCALTAALSCAGLDESHFTFLGFPPSKKSQRRKLLQKHRLAGEPLIFYESPHRMNHFLLDSLEILGDREIVIARELTKKFEEFLCTTLELVQTAELLTLKGEFVVIINPAEDSGPDEGELDDLILWYRDNSSVTLKDCSKILSADFPLSRSEIYKRALELWKDKK